MTEPTPTPDRTRPEVPPRRGRSDRMTGRLRLIVRLLDIYADDLNNGTQLEHLVTVLLTYCAIAIVNDDVELAVFAIYDTGLMRKPRADKLAAAQEAAMVEVDRLDLDLPDSYSGIGA